MCYLSVKSFQMHVPNGVGAFGSTYRQIDDLHEGWNFYLKRTRWRKLDRPSQRCDEEIRHVHPVQILIKQHK